MLLRSLTRWLAAASRVTFLPLVVAVGALITPPNNTIHFHDEAAARPFLEHLASSSLSPKTIQKHVDNMWALGGEFIRELNYDPPLRKKPVEQVLLKMLQYGGPMLYHGGEDEQRSFDATCRKFKRFLNETAQ
jgi:hypothetical protein